MKSFFDLSESERAALTTEQVEAFAASELMRVGCLRAAPLILEPEPPIPEPSHTVYRVKGGRYGQKLDIGFMTADDALAFLALRPSALDNDYIGNRSVVSAKPIATDSEVSAEKVYAADVLTACKADITKGNQIREDNERVRREHDKAVSAEQTALAAMWADWRECRSKAANMERIVETYREYVKIACGGSGFHDEESDLVAGRFLLKVFPREQIEAAGEWCKVAIVLPAASEAETQPSAPVTTNGAEDAPAF